MSYEFGRLALLYHLLEVPVELRSHVDSGLVFTEGFCKIAALGNFQKTAGMPPFSE